MLGYLGRKSFFLFILFASSLAQAQQDPGDSGAHIGLKDTCKDPAYKDSETCSHARMLHEGDNVYAIYQMHADTKVVKMCDAFLSALGCSSAAAIGCSASGCNAAGASGSSAAAASNTSVDDIINRAKVDGTCLESDKQGADPTKSAKACLDRLRRQALDAKLRARQEMVRQNNGRYEMLVRDGAKVQKDLIPDTLGATSPPPPKDTVLKDINDSVALVPSVANPQQKVMRLLATPQVVNFDTPSPEWGDATTSGKTLDKLKTVDTAKEAPDVVSDSSETAKYEVTDADAQAGDVVLNKALGKKQATLTKGYQKDLVDLKRGAGQMVNGVAVNPANADYKGGKGAGASVSADALAEVMKSLNEQAAKKNGIKPLPDGSIPADVVNSENAILPLSDTDVLTKSGEKADPSTNKNLKLDKRIEDDLSAQ